MKVEITPARRSTSSTTKNDRLFERFVQLIGMSQIREPTQCSVKEKKICLIYEDDEYSIRRGSRARKCGLITLKFSPCSHVYTYINFLRNRDIVSTLRRSLFLRMPEKGSAILPIRYNRRNQFCYIARDDDKSRKNDRSIDRFGRHRFASRSRYQQLQREKKRNPSPRLWWKWPSLVSPSDDFGEGL